LALLFVGLATARFTVFLRVVARLLPTFDFVVRLFLLAIATPMYVVPLRLEEALGNDPKPQTARFRGGIGKPVLHVGGIEADTGERE